ncbi:hypothetical protein T484DRAFT_1914274 [Baffinella frigidus]|nr:hypothetical protein T484DRAFT_1914274 [Cryptophyta sp. CCMP2293]
MSVDKINSKVAEVAATTTTTVVADSAEVPVAVEEHVADAAVAVAVVVAVVAAVAAAEAEDIRRWFSNSNRPAACAVPAAVEEGVAVEAFAHAAAQPPPDPADVPLMESSSEGAAASTSRNSPAPQMTAAGQRNPRIRKPTQRLRSSDLSQRLHTTFNSPGRKVSEEEEALEALEAEEEEGARPRRKAAADGEALRTFLMQRSKNRARPTTTTMPGGGGSSSSGASAGGAGGVAPAGALRKRVRSKSSGDRDRKRKRKRVRNGVREGGGDEGGAGGDDGSSGSSGDGVNRGGPAHRRDWGLREVMLSLTPPYKLNP